MNGDAGAGAGRTPRQTAGEDRRIADVGVVDGIVFSGRHFEVDRLTAGPQAELGHVTGGRQAREGARQRGR